MTLDEVLKKLSEPESLNSPEEINTLQSYLNGFISELEDEVWNRELVASTKMAELIETNPVNKAEILFKVSNEYRLFKGVDRSLKKLRRYRQDLRDRMNLLIGKPTRY